MGAFEEKYVYEKDPKLKFWYRFIDDIIGLYQGTEDELQEFVHNLNSVHPTIKFTLEHSREKVVFLDTVVHLENNRIWTDLYCKPTDSHSYLHYSSAHPYHTKKSLPYSQLLRLERICSRESDFLHHTGMILYHFTKRGYPLDILQTALDKVHPIDRRTLLTAKDTDGETEEIVALTTMYIPQFEELPRLVKKNWTLLQRSSTTKKIGDKKLITSYRRPKNLRDILVRARLPKITNEDRSAETPLCEHANKCKNKQDNCRYCLNLDRSGHITSHATGRSYI